MLGMFRDLIRYRYFIIISIKNDILSRFANSKLGALWVLINPLAQVAIFALILSNVLAAKLPGITNKYAYAIYLMSGLLVWTLFNDIFNRCLNMFIDQGNMIKKINFPRITLPLIVVGTSMVNNFLLFAATMLIFVSLGHNFTWMILWIVPLHLSVILFTTSLGLIFGIMNVFIRDIGQSMPIILQMLFWFTPIVYPINIVPAEYHHLFYFNPIISFTEAYQNILTYGIAPNLVPVSIITGIGFALALLSLLMFRRANSELVDHI